MGKQIASAATISHIRNKIIARILPDFCEIYEPNRKVIRPSGSYEDVPGARVTYKGLPNIPCRLDQSQHYRADTILGQEVVLNDFELHVPWDAPLYGDYTIVFKGEKYEVRKLLDTHSFNMTKIAVVDRIDIGKRPK